MDLPFRIALPAFAVGLTVMYVIFLFISAKLRRDEGDAGSRWGRPLIMTTFVLGTSTISTLFIAPEVRATATYSVLASATTASLLCTLWLYRGSKTLPAPILLCALIFYVMVVWVPPPSTGFSMGERTSKLVALSQAQHWGPDWDLVDPAYDPFPMNIGIPLMTSLATSLPFYAYDLFLLLYLPFVLGYAVTVYALAKNVTESWFAGIVAVVILGVTAPVSILGHPAQWIGNLLVLVSTLALIKLVKTDKMGSPYVLAIDLCYAVAILMHASAAIAIFIPMSIFSVDYLLKRSSRNNGSNVRSDSMNFLGIFFATFFVITFGRMMYTAGYLEYLLPYLVNFVREVYGFVEPAVEPTGQAFIPLYDRAAVAPLYAYAWATSVAMGAAFIVYLLVRRKRLRENPSIPALFMAAATFVLAGYIAGAAFKTPTSPSFWRGMYVALPLTLPAAAAAGATILRSRGVMASILVALLVIGVGVAVDDPMISTYSYHEIRGRSEILESNSTDVWEIQRLNPTLPESPTATWISTFQFEWTLHAVRLTQGNLQGFPMTTLSKSEAISAFLQREESKTVYILPREILSEPINLTVDLLFSGPKRVILADE